MSAEFSQTYDPSSVEDRWYQAWIESRCFQGRADSGKEPYSIVIPPPNVTGVLHIGHVLNNSIQDVLVRRARLEGKAACWIPGTDHASISTHSVVERQLRKDEGKTRWDIGRDAFLERTKIWQEKHGGIILKQLKAMGCSCDWDRTVFTMDPDYNRSVLTAFSKLFAAGRIYRGKRMVNWCPATLTALSDEEVIMKPQKGLLYKMRYEVVEEPGRFLEISTTRPETLMGDTGVAVHPQDERYRGLVGKHVWRPFPREAIPIVEDSAIDIEFGTGVLKVTPAHDRVDYDIGRRHGLPVVDVLNPDGTLNHLAGPDFDGMDRFKARKLAVEKLRDLGLLVAEEPYENNVGFSERADVPIEPRLTWQWWMRYPRVEEAKKVVEDGLIRFHPERWSKVYLHWLNNIQDWCISRQLWWGQRIPVWYRKGTDRATLTEEDLQDPSKVHVSVDGPDDPENWEQEDDVLDTWASSWLWPIGTLGWPDVEAEAERGFEAFYPTNTLVTAPEIIFFWVARMIMAGLEFARPGEPVERRIPFRNVYFTGIVRDAQGRKMSKSLGNSPDPLDLIGKYGADGLRFGILSVAPQGQDIRFAEERIEGGRNFCNKLWNACRFRTLSGPAGDNSSLAAIAGRLDRELFDNDDHAILDQLNRATGEVGAAFADFEFSRAVQALYTFFWNDFCDWYVEVSKAKLQNKATRDNSLAVQDLVLRQTLLLLHPFIPFVTEELWHQLGYGTEGDFIQDAVLDFDLEALGLSPDPSAAGEVTGLKSMTASARALKADYNLASRKDVALFVAADDTQWAVIEANRAKIERMAGAATLNRTESMDSAPAVITPFGTLYLDLASSVDVGAERERLTKELAQLEKAIASAEARLGNEKFTAKAPPEVVAGARKQLEDNRSKAVELARLLKSLGA
ncbi:MAG: valine--tRNA ligase [Opitutaceae bacterium]